MLSRGGKKQQWRNLLDICAAFGKTEPGALSELRFCFSCQTCLTRRGQDESTCLASQRSGTSCRGGGPCSSNTTGTDLGPSAAWSCSKVVTLRRLNGSCAYSPSRLGRINCTMTWWKLILGCHFQLWPRWATTSALSSQSRWSGATLCEANDPGSSWTASFRCARNCSPWRRSSGRRTTLWWATCALVTRTSWPVPSAGSCEPLPLWTDRGKSSLFTPRSKCVLQIPGAWKCYELLFEVTANVLQSVLQIQ